jgi:hypothetical protein
MEGRRLIICGLLLMLTGGLMVFSSYKRIGNENENEKLTNKLKEKQLRIDELESEVEILEDEISEREIEIKFWGMKYDSIKQK